MTHSVQSRLGVLALTCVGALVVVKAYALGLGKLETPGAGLWPFIVGLLIVAVGIALLIMNDLSTVEKIDRRVVLILVAAATLIVFAVMFERTGFEIPTFMLLLVWMRGFGRETWRLSMGIALGTTVAVYLLFVVALRVSLPHLF